MLKFVKGTLENIDDVQFFPIISLLIFFIFFISMFWWVITAKKNHLSEMSHMPLEEDSTNQNRFEL